MKFLIGQQKLIIDQLHRVERPSWALIREVIAISMTVNDEQIDEISQQLYEAGRSNLETNKLIFEILSRIGAIIQETSKVETKSWWQHLLRIS